MWLGLRNTQKNRFWKSGSYSFRWKSQNLFFWSYVVFLRSRHKYPSKICSLLLTFRRERIYSPYSYYYINPSLLNNVIGKPLKAFSLVISILPTKWVLQTSCHVVECDFIYDGEEMLIKLGTGSESPIQINKVHHTSYVERRRKEYCTVEKIIICHEQICPSTPACYIVV